jgi:flagellar biosynthesis/type III secretory pathway protein FliH
VTPAWRARLRKLSRMKPEEQAEGLRQLCAEAWEAGYKAGQEYGAIEVQILNDSAGE